MTDSTRQQSEVTKRSRKPSTRDASGKIVPRREQARLILMATWGLNDLPAEDDPDVEYLLRNGDELSARYARAVAWRDQGVPYSQPGPVVRDTYRDPSTGFAQATIPASAVGLALPDACADDDPLLA